MTVLTIRLLRKLFTAETMGLALALIALQIFIQGITASLQNTDTRYFYLFCLSAALIGLGSGKRNSGPIQASVGMVALGAAGVWIVGARLSVPLIHLIREVVKILPQVNPYIHFKSPIDTSGISEVWSVIVAASFALATRFQTWFIGLNQSVNVNDALIRNMIWLFALWLIAAWMGWHAARRDAIVTIAPALLTLAFITSYSERRVEMIWGLVFVTLLLMGVWNYRNHTQHWETRKYDYSESIRYDNTQAVLALAALVGFFAFVTPSVSWREVREFFRSRDENKIAQALGVQERPIQAIKISMPKPTMPRKHLLSGGYAHSEKIVMTVRTGELPPIANPPVAAEAPRYYWRSVVYDEYVGAGWVTSAAPPQKYDADTPLIPGLLIGYKPIHLDAQLREPEGRLFWSGTLFSADIPLTVEWRVRPTLNLFADQSALIQPDMFAAATEADHYTAEAYIPNVAIDELRLASTDYPEEIRARYLALPYSVPERVHRLAIEITAGRSLPYNKVKAIERYLRTNYPYDLEVPAPPPDRDVADYFLFDLKKGYCDYYATAMVVLARASGVPARFVSGYGPGTYDAPDAQYIVREKDAHSWVEVYFPKIGWVEFEPTASIPEIIRKETKEPLSAAQETDDTASKLLSRFRLETLARFLLPLLVVIVSVILYFAFIEKWRYMAFAPAVAIEMIYKKFYRAGRPLAGIRTRAETSHEFTEKLINAVNAGQSSARRKKFYRALQSEINLLTNIYHSALFRDIQTGSKDFHIAWTVWRNLRWRLWFARIGMSLRAFFAKQSFRKRRLLLEDSQRHIP